MKKLLVCVLAVILSACVSVLPVTIPPPENITEDFAVKNAMYSVVRISVESKDGMNTLNGSGWANTEDTILTAGHVCEAIIQLQAVGILKDDIRISYLNRINTLDTKHNVSIVDMDGIHDICLLYLEDHGLPVLEFGESDVEFGEKIWILGFPLGVALSAMPGEVMAVNTGKGKLPLIMRNRLIVSSAATGGNSGGPVVDSAGRVVGMLVAGPDGYDHLSICVPAKRVQKFLELI